MKDFKVLCTICARGGSIGIKNKNIKNLNGQPLISYTIKQAQEAEIFEHIVISTDSDEIAQISKEYGAEVFFKRSPEMASDTAGKLDVIRDAFLKSEEHFTEQYDYFDVIFVSTEETTFYTLQIPREYWSALCPKMYWYDGSYYYETGDPIVKGSLVFEWWGEVDENNIYAKTVFPAQWADWGGN